MAEQTARPAELKHKGQQHERTQGSRRSARGPVQHGARTMQQFFMKFGNDWVMGFASGLAFNLLSAIIPIFIALIALFGLFLGGLAPEAKSTLIANLQNVFPPPLSSGGVLQPALNSIHRNVGWLGVIAVLTAIIGGSGLFVSMEGYFDVIYHAHPRGLVQQYIMAFSMLLFFLILIPVMVFGASVPAFVLSLLQATPLHTIPGSGLLFSLGGIGIGLSVSWVFFLVIYIVVPNQRISFRHSWKGAVAAAIALQLYLILFPLYVTHFLVSDTGTTGFALILLFFFYYFAVILLAGAEVNAFFGEDIRVTPDNVAAMIHDLTSHLPTSEEGIQQQASASHKDEEPKSILPQKEARKLQQLAQQATLATSATSTREQTEKKQRGNPPALKDGSTNNEQVAVATVSKRETFVGLLTVAVVTVLVEFFRHKPGK